MVVFLAAGLASRVRGLTALTTFLANFSWLARSFLENANCVSTTSERVGTSARRASSASISGSSNGSSISEMRPSTNSTACLT